MLNYRAVFRLTALVALLALASCDDCPEDTGGTGGPCVVDLPSCDARKDLGEQPEAYQDGYELGLGGPWPIEYSPEWCALGPDDASPECADWWDGVGDGTKRLASCSWSTARPR